MRNAPTKTAPVRRTASKRNNGRFTEISCLTSKTARIVYPVCPPARWLARNGLGEVRLARGGARPQEAAGGEKLGVEKGCASGAADEVVREEREFDVEQGTPADAADDHGHAVAEVDVVARLRP